MARSSTFTPQPAPAVCTHYGGAEVSLTVPGPGTVVVESIVFARAAHTNGATSQLDGHLHLTNTDCTVDSPGFAYVPGVQPSGTYFQEISMIKGFAIGAAGVYTFYFNALAVFGSWTSWSASMVAVFYPS